MDDVTKDSQILRKPVLRPEPMNPVFKIKAPTTDEKAETTDGYDNFASRVGMNNNNTLSAGVYTFSQMTNNRVQLEAGYRGSWIVGVVVDAVAEDMTKSGINITTNEAEEDIKDLQSALSKWAIWDSLSSFLKWSRLYGGSIAVMQIKGQELSKPLNLETIGKGQFEGLAVFDRWQINPDLTSCIRSGPSIGLPEYYNIVTYEANLQGKLAKSGQIKVHHSRIFRGIGIELPYFQAITENMWGESILERLWDRLIAFDNATMSCASLIDRANLRTVQVEGLREILAAGGPAQQALEKMFEMMRLLQTNEGLTLLDKNDEFSSTAYSFAGLAETLLQFGQQLAGASGIPLVRLFGQSPAGLNATGDGEIRLYYDNIRAQQEKKLRAGLDTLIRVIWRSTFGNPEPKDLEFSFVPLWQMSATDKANIGKTNTESVLGAYEAGLVSRSTGMKELRAMSGDTGLFSNISDEDVDEAEEAELVPEPDEIGAETLTPDPKEPVSNLDSKPTAGQRMKRMFKKRA